MTSGSVGNEGSHRWDGGTIKGGLAIEGPNGGVAYLNTDVNGTLYVNGIALAAPAGSATQVVDTRLTWPFPETDSPIILTVSAAVAITSSTGTQTFNTCANGVVSGVGSSGDGGGGIAGCTIELTSLGSGGAVIFESSTNGGSSWSTLTVTKISDATTATTASAAGAWYVVTTTYTTIRVRATALTSGTITGTIMGNKCTAMLANQDYILKCPVPITLSYPNIGALKLSGGRHIIAIGGEIQVPLQTASGDTYSRAVYTEGATGIVHFEGWYIHGVDCSDGFQLYSPEAIIQIQNCRIGDPTQPITAHNLATFSDKHPDVIEAEGGWREFRVDKLTGWSYYQGIFLNQTKTKHGRFNVLRRVDLNGVNVQPTGVLVSQTNNRQLFWQGDDSGRTIVDQFYVQGASEQDHNGFYMDLQHSCRYYGYAPISADVNLRSVTIGTNDTSLGSRAQTAVYWPPKAAVVGKIELGPPPTGEFVSATSGVGCAYISPGYMHINEAPTYAEVSSTPLAGRAIRPCINKLKSWSYDPVAAVASCAPPASGTIYLVKMPIEETLYETTGLVFMVETAGVNLTANCFAAIYDRKGNKLAASAAGDLTTQFATTGQKSIVLVDVSPYTPMAAYHVGGYGEFFFVALLLNWTTSGPKFSALVDSAEDAVLAARFNLGVDGTGAGFSPTGKFVIRFQKNLAAQTALPATIAFGSSSPTSFAPLIGFN